MPGDPHEAQVEVLLQHSQWVRRLADRLFSDDAARADDLVQDTWVSAFTQPAVEPARARGWLAQIMKHQWLHRLREESRRERRERRAARPEALPSTVEDLAVDVRVIDRAGRPVPGVPVAFGILGANPSGQGIAALTGPDGLAHVKHLRDLVDAFGHLKRAWSVQIAVPIASWLFKEDIEAAVDPFDLPASPLVLVLPETGRVRIRARDALGNPAPEGAWVALTACEMSSSAGAHPPTFDYIFRLAQGEAICPFVGLRLQVYPVLFCQDPASPPGSIARQWTNHLILGPTSPGEEVTIELLAPGPSISFLGRLIGRSGSPLARCRLSATIEGRLVEGARRSEDELRTSTDEKGLFAFGFFRRWKPGESGWLNLCWMEEPHPGAEPQECRARLDVSIRESREIDCGDVVAQ
ncbi:MAG: sigma factor [Planctomycetota bacterium]